MPSSTEPPSTRPKHPNKLRPNGWGEPAKAGTRLIAWVIEHNSHGIVFDTLVFLPEGEEPETKEEWRRMPWLDQSLAPFDPKICAFAGCGKPSHGLFGGDGPGTGVPKCVDHCREDLPIRREAAHVDQLRAWQLERELANQAAQTKLAEIGAKLVEAAKQQDPKFPPGWDNDLPLKPRFHSTVEREEYESRERAKKIALDLRTGKKIEEAFIEAAINDPATDVKTAVKAAMDRVARVLNDRRGYHVDCLDEETRNDLLREIVGVVFAPELLEERNAEIKQLRDQLYEARKASRGNSERAHQLHEEREAVKLQRDEAHRRRDETIAQLEEAYTSMQTAHRNLGAAQLKNQQLEKQLADQLQKFLDERAVRDGLIIGPNGVHYEMGRADERIGSDKLLGEAESAISSWISVSIPRAAGALYELLERIRAYRKGTEAVRVAGIERGWYPKDSS